MKTSMRHTETLGRRCLIILLAVPVIMLLVASTVWIPTTEQILICPTRDTPGDSGGGKPDKRSRSFFGATEVNYDQEILICPVIKKPGDSGGDNKDKRSRSSFAATEVNYDQQILICPVRDKPGGSGGDKNDHAGSIKSAFA